ncbi:DUF397 domain-containing protein [Actinokineospora sp. HUAS TT18]|uniref:DUF397 domain-containing protein n=1 Tax=Actinokineospora sp. HUAS TT18 TaxID=3447451 RepID=UPI003F524A8F
MTSGGWRKSSHSTNPQGSCVEVLLSGWRKSSHSTNPQGDCVEVLLTDRAVAVRDSKNADGPFLAVAAPAWAAFVTSLTD